MVSADRRGRARRIGKSEAERLLQLRATIGPRGADKPVVAVQFALGRTVLAFDPAATVAGPAGAIVGVWQQKDRTGKVLRPYIDPTILPMLLRSIVEGVAFPAGFDPQAPSRFR